MTPEAFAYWLQGFFELTNSEELSPAQVKMVKEHLQLVFNKVTSPLDEQKLPITWPFQIQPMKYNYADYTVTCDSSPTLLC